MNISTLSSECLLRQRVVSLNVKPAIFYTKYSLIFVRLPLWFLSKMCIVRCGVRTHALLRVSELKSDALDHSANLTWIVERENSRRWQPSTVQQSQHSSTADTTVWCNTDTGQTEIFDDDNFIAVQMETFQIIFFPTQSLNQEHMAAFICIFSIDKCVNFNYWEHIF